MTRGLAAGGAVVVLLVLVATAVVVRSAAPGPSAVAAPGSVEGASGGSSASGLSAAGPGARPDRAAVRGGLGPGVALDPRGHRPGGCVAHEPDGEPRGTVVLDAGHGAPDPGASGRTAGGRLVSEDEVTLDVALDAAARLRAEGVRVVLTRSGDGLGARLGADQVVDGVLTIDGLRAQLSARARCANLAGADALVSIHLNAAEDPDVRGTETLYDPDRPFSADNRELAAALHRSVLDGLRRAGVPAVDRGLGEGGGGVARGDLVLLAPASDRVREPSLVPGALVEPLFLSHPDEAGFAASDAGRDALAAAVADGVRGYLADTVP